MIGTLAVAATAWGVLMALAPLLQVRVIVRERDASGTSKTWIVILLIGFALWFCYGVATRTWPLIVSNVVSGAVAMVLLVVAVMFTKRSVERTPNSGADGQPGDPC